MAENANVTRAREMIEAMNRGDMQALDGYIADDVVWHEIGRSEPRRGKAELAAAGLGGDYQISGKLHDVVGNDDHTVALVEATATRDGKTFTYRTAEILPVKDGKITERWAFSDDTDGSSSSSPKPADSGAPRSGPPSRPRDGPVRAMPAMVGCPSVPAAGRAPGGRG